MQYKLSKIKEAQQKKGLKSVNEAEEEAKKKKGQKLILCTKETKYRVVKKSCRRLEFKFNDDENADWDLFWGDTGIMPPRVQKMNSYQRVNHYPGMYSLSHKNHLCRNLKRMQKQFPVEYDFFPKTWILPYENNDFKN